MNIRFHENAVADLDYIRTSIAIDDPRAAQAVLLRIDHSIALLESFPQISRVGLVEGTREKPVSRTPYIVVYEQVGAFDIWILNVIHGRQSYPPDI